MPNYSKAPRGLFVLVELGRVFTAIAISPSRGLRQLLARDAIRAGRNLPDKEFRYLRTVIVTAAVHQGLDSKHTPLLLTFWHWAGVSSYTSSYDLARTCVFDKQLQEFIRCGLHQVDIISRCRQGLSRSYACCFAEFLKRSYPDHLGILYQSTSVGLRYGKIQLSKRGFSRPLNSPESAPCGAFT